jgi:hypothetical protein
MLARRRSGRPAAGSATLPAKGLAQSIEDHYSLRTLRVLVILLAASL